MPSSLSLRASVFLSTPSARRATFPTSKPTRKQSYFYPRPPRGGRPTPSKTGRRGGDFYPRPPRGGRPLKDDGLVAIKKFLSTPSARRATACENHRTRPECYFYPRPPRGGRRAALRLLHPRRPISIHALREEGDALLAWSHAKVRHFYPRPPRGGRRTTSATTSCVAYFYPRPPRGGRLFKDQELTQVIDDFYPRPPRGGRREVLVENYSLRYISIHALREEGDD